MPPPIVLSHLGKVREDKRLTVKQLALKVGVEPSVINDIELGATTSQIQAKEIADVLQLESYDLLIDKKEEVGGKQTESSFRSLATYLPVMFVALAISLFSIVYLSKISMDTMIMLVLILAIIPVSIIIHMPSEKKCDRDSCPRLTFWLFIGFSLFVSSISSSIFLGMSFALHPDNYEYYKLGRVLLETPGVNNFFSLYGRNLNLIYLASGGVLLFSVISLSLLSNKARKENLYLGCFSTVVLLSLVSSSLISFLFSIDSFSILSEASNKANNSIAVSLWAILCLVIIKIFKIGKGEGNLICAGMLVSLIPITLTSLLLYTAFNYINHRVDLSADHENKISYCESVRNDDADCWGVELLIDGDIPITESSLRIIETRNGNLASFKSLYFLVDIPSEYAIEKKPLPAAVLSVFADGYYNMILAQSKAGTLDFVLSNEAFGSLELAERIKWSSLAKDNIAEFVKEYQKNSVDVEGDVYLKTIYEAAMGNWRVVDIGDEKYYELGVFLVTYPGGENESKIDLELFEKSYNVSDDDLPVKKVIN